MTDRTGTTVRQKFKIKQHTGSTDRERERTDRRDRKVN